MITPKNHDNSNDDSNDDTLIAREIKNKLGRDADLLVKSNEWLAFRRQVLLSQIQECADELYVIYQAERVKRDMRPHDKVAAMVLHRDRDGQISDVSINIVKSVDAVRTVSGKSGDIYDTANKSAQMANWRSDGYDL